MSEPALSRVTPDGQAKIYIVMGDNVTTETTYQLKEALMETYAALDRMRPTPKERGN